MSLSERVIDHKYLNKLPFVIADSCQPSRCKRINRVKDNES